jgi:hypothetical protein
VRRGVAVVLALLVLSVPSFAAPPPERIAVLRRGINITGWFRFPASRDPVVLRAWLGDAAMATLHGSGFTFVRLATDPTVLDSPPMRAMFVQQIRRLQSHGLAVAISAHPVSWSVDTNMADRVRLVAFWHDLAPALRGLPPALTFPEVLNEPVFHDDQAGWQNLQHQLLASIRSALPDDTVILTGQDWGSIAGLLALTPETDDNVVYSLHYYDPVELTSLAAWNPALDHATLAGLPFPETDRARCEHVSDASADEATRGLIRFWCATGWDAARVRSRIQDAVDWAKRHGVALLAGEFGATAELNPAARLAWLRLVRETCAENGIGWALWGYDDVMGFNVARPPGNNPELDRSVLKALGLPVN